MGYPGSLVYGNYVRERTLVMRKRTVTTPARVFVNFCENYIQPCKNYSTILLVAGYSVAGKLVGVFISFVSPGVS